MKFEMLGLFTDRFAEMKQFYAEVLGFEVSVELEKYVEFTGQGVRFAICERGVMAETVSAEHFDQPTTGRPVSLAFRSATKEALAADYARLVEKGATAIREPGDMPWGQHTAFFADPDGHIHELFCDLPT